MKPRQLTVCASVLIVGAVQAGFAQTPEPGLGQTDATSYRITERGSDHRVWSRLSYETNHLGRVIAHTNSYTELETGMHYLEDGQWLETEAQIEILPNGAGAAATKGPHKVIFAPNLATVGAVDMEAPDNKRLRSQIMGLSYFDSATGEAVLIAEPKDCIGQLLPPNEIIYVDAFNDVKADVQYVYSKAGFAQNIILRAQPPAPEDFGFDRVTTRLQVLTEFLDPPVVRKEIVLDDRVNGLRDERLNFGEMEIGRGKAFAIGQETGRSTRVYKQWTVMDGRTFLVEEVPLAAIAGALQTLPERPVAALKKHRQSEGESVIAALGNHLTRRTAGHTTNVIQVAKLDSRVRRGFVLDYEFLSGASNFTFKGDTTYYCTNGVNLSGTSTIEGGTVIKFSTNTSARITCSGTIACKTSAYRPALFTAKDDDTAGEKISGSSGIPSGYYGGGALVIPSAVALSYMRFSYQDAALDGSAALDDGTLSDLQFVRCKVVLRNDFGYGFAFRNCLFYDTRTNFYGPGQLTAENATFYKCAELFVDWDVGWGSALKLTNCLGVAVTNLGSNYTLTTNSTVIFTNDPGILQTVGAGAHYLATNSPYRNAGTTNINASLLSALRKKTTYPPVVIFGAQLITNDAVLVPQAQRDTDTPDLGYHYDPLDFALGHYFFSNCKLTIQPGTAVGTFQTNADYPGIQLAAGAELFCVGAADNLNRIVRINMVQEQANTNWSAVGPSVVNDAVGFPGATVGRFRFTEWSMSAQDDCHFHDSYQSITGWFADCSFRGGRFDVTTIPLQITNSLFERVALYLSDGSGSQLQLNFRNNLFVGGRLDMEHLEADTWSFRDNLFDGTLMTPQGNVDGDYNGYINGATRLTPTHTNDIVTNLTYQVGPLGNYYQPTNSPFINAGSTNAALIGLYHNTTLTNQVKEVTTRVDIGLHYVAVTNGVPVDTDGDGIPDYLEDNNGNGSVNSGETDWQNAMDLGLRVLITRPRNNSSVP